MPKTEIIHGDCLVELPKLAAEGRLFDACVTDPPYHLTSIVKRFGKQDAAPVKDYGKSGVYKRSSTGFMGKQWDGGDIAANPETWSKVYDVLKPGAHLLAFGGTRTYHRMVCAIEDAGFEIRDQIMWLYGSGFPKSLDVSKAIDRRAPREGMFSNFARHYAERRLAVGITHNAVCEVGKFYARHNHGGASSNWENGANVPTLEQWSILQPLLGLSTEWLPLIEREEANRIKIGERRSGDPTAWFSQSERGEGIVDISIPSTDKAKQWSGWGTALKPAHEPIVLARKPLSEPTIAANVLAHGCGALNIDACRVPTEESTKRPLGYKLRPNSYGSQDSRNGEHLDRIGGSDAGRWPANVIHDGSDEVEAAFAAFGEKKSGVLHPWHDAKASDNGSMSGRNYAGRVKSSFGGDSGTTSRFYYTAKAGPDDRMDSKHPTVKPLSLMYYLVKLITPVGGTILDPFAGSGSTLHAARKCNFNSVGIELEEDYVKDIRHRLKATTGLFDIVAGDTL